MPPQAVCHRAVAERSDRKVLGLRTIHEVELLWGKD